MRSFSLFCFYYLLCGLLSSQPLYFPAATGNAWEMANPSDLGWCTENIPNLLEFLEKSETKGFIVLKDGKIIIEEYMNGHRQDSVWYWASAGKSLNAFEVGMLQEDGLIDINDPTSEYLGQGWTSCTTEQEEEITIRNQLTMTTGLNYVVDDIDCTDPSCLTYLNEPYEEWYYHNAPYTLLSDVIENVTNRSHTFHTFLTLGNDIGLRGAWIPLGFNNVFFSTPRVMARFGLLMNARGKWDDRIILGDEEFFDQMITPSQNINEAYGYLWWLNSGSNFRLPSTTITFPGKLIPDASDQVYAAIGKNSQVLMVDPVENIVVVRMGEDPDDALVPTTFINDMWVKLKEVICSSTNVEESRVQEISISPNPVQDYISISSSVEIDQIIIYDELGREVFSKSAESSYDLSFLPRGMYTISIHSSTSHHSRKLIKL